MQTITDQSYIQPYDFITRAEFQEHNNVTPEEVKLRTSTFTDSAGESVCGILCHSEDPPRVEVQRAKIVFFVVVFVGCVSGAGLLSMLVVVCLWRCVVRCAYTVVGLGSWVDGCDSWWC